MYIYMHMGRVLQMLTRLVCFVFFSNSEACHIKALSESFNGYFRIYFFLSFSKFSRLKGSRLHSFGDIIG